MNEVLKDLTTVALAIVAVAVVGLIVANKSNATGVINAGGNAFSNALATAQGAVTGYTPPASSSSASSFAPAAFNFSTPELGAGNLTGA